MKTQLAKRIVAAACTMALMVSMTACGESEKENGDKSSDALQVAIPAFWSDWGKELAKEYEEANPDANIEIVEVASGDDMYTKMTMMMQSSDTAPDILTEDGFMLKSDAAAGYLEPLNDYLKDWEDWKQFDENVLAVGQGSDGVQYGVPFSTDVQGIWYDKTLFEKAGIEVPWQPTSWEEILNAAEKIKALGEEITPIYMYSSKSTPEETSMRTFQTLYSGTGADLYDYEQDKWLINNEALTATLEFINDIFNVKKVGPSANLVTTENVELVFQEKMFKEHTLGMLFSGSHVANNWKEGKNYEWAEWKDNVGFAKLPTVEGAGEQFTTMSGGWTWSIPKNANHKDEAMEFMKFVASKEQQTASSVANGDLAVRKDVLESEEYKTAQALPEETTEMLQYAHFRPTVDGYSSVTTLYTEMIENVALAGMSVEDAVSNFEQQLETTVGADKILKK